MKKDVIIIGSGPAGLTAAIYAARARLDTLLAAGVEYGGQLMTTTLVENFPGFKEGVMGPELMMNMVQQTKNQGAEVINKYVSKVDFTGPAKKVWIGDDEYEADAVIIAAGSTARKLSIPGEQEFWGKGVSTCATCDGAFYRDKVIAVIGGGDSAMEEATFLTRFASKVHVIHRRAELRASAAMQERAKANEKIEFIWNTEVEEVIGDQKVTGLKLKNIEDGAQSELMVDGMFLAIGHLPNSTFIEGHVDLDEKGYVKVQEGTRTFTSVDGVFVAGDIHDAHYEQAITAAGMGCMAAMDAEKWLAARGK